MNSDNKVGLILICVIFLAASLLLAGLFVNTHDDYFIPDTGTDFRGSVTYALTMGNGRYIGNVLGTYLPVRYVPNLIVRGVLLWGSAVLLAAAFTDFTAASLTLSGLLLIFPGALSYAQSYQWAHGFYNYVPPLLPMLASIGIIRRAGKEAGKSKCVWLVLFGIVQSLFAENITAVCDLAAALLVLYALSDKEKPLSFPISYLFGSLLGTALMFLGPKLYRVSGELGWYRGVNLPGDPMFISRMAENAIYMEDTVIGWNILFAVLFTVLAVRQREVKHSGTPALLSILACLGIAAPLCYRFAPAYKYLIPMSSLEAVLAFILVWQLFDRDTLRRLLLPAVTALASVSELLLVQPVGARCLAVTYFLFSGGVLIMAETVLKTAPERLAVLFRRAAATGLCLLYATVAVLQFCIFKADRFRIQAVETQLAQGKSEILVPELPFPLMTHFANDSWMYMYTYNHGDPEEMEFIYIPRESLSG